ncbi:MAG TPA: CorA family divalent cation transporter [Rhodanobacteraceae bacterium]|nr:CorA family divalent cation transporter [Rhodanobacteraceae bacterium]
MLSLHNAGRAQPIVHEKGAPLPGDATWYDLDEPDEDEIRRVEQATGLEVPRREQIGGLGLSNRNRVDERALHLHMALYTDDDGTPACSPLGMVVTRESLLTLRFAKSKAVDTASRRLRESDDDKDGAGAFATLLETIANHVAEQMQEIAADMARLSARVFVEEYLDTRTLHRLILSVGKLESRLTRYRTSLLGVARMVGFVEHRAPDWMPEAALLRLHTIANDLKTLDEFDDQLTGKLQFLLDAILGFINTDQNAVMKLLTAASVVTIPPIILAAIWGMNFRHMPDLDPRWAYPAALLAILASIVLPLLWFKRRGWLSRD